MLVFVTGLAAAIAAGMATYRELGLYGGPVLTGFHREWNQQTRKPQLIHEMTTRAGLRVRRVLNDDLTVERTVLSGETVGVAAEQLVGRGARVAFSTRNDGVMDAWIIRDEKGQTARVEMSTTRDGKIDRWEQYAGGQLVRVDLDLNGNGKPDQWLTYEDGILMDTFIDGNEDGRPDDHKR